MNFIKLLGLVSFGALAACAGSASDNGKSSASNDTEGNTNTPAACTDADNAAMASAPIFPPNRVAGVDFGADFASNSTLTWSAVEQSTCAASSEAPFEDSNGSNAGTAAIWGPLPANSNSSEEFEPLFDVQYNDDGLVTGWSVGTGYTGVMTFVSRPDASASQPNPFGHHVYAIAIGQPVLRDGEPFDIDWTGGTFSQQVTELVDAIMFTFDPAGASTQGDCVAEGTCNSEASAPGNDSPAAYFSSVALGLGVSFEPGDDGTFTPDSIWQDATLSSAQ